MPYPVFDDGRAVGAEQHVNGCLAERLQTEHGQVLVVQGIVCGQLSLQLLDYGQHPRLAIVGPVRCRGGRGGEYQMSEVVGYLRKPQHSTDRRDQRQGFPHRKTRGAQR